MKLSQFMKAEAGTMSWEEYEQRLERLAECIVQEQLALESLEARKK